VIVTPERRPTAKYLVLSQKFSGFKGGYEGGAAAGIDL
jgi:hypothetical protein